MRFARYTLFILLAALFPTASAEAQPRTRAVLVLDQSARLSPFSDLLVNSFFSRLSEQGGQVAAYVESLDLARFGSPEYYALVRTFLRSKYKDVPLGAIVAGGTEGLRLASDLRPEIWPDVPLLFVAFTPQAAANLPLNTTGVVAPLRFANLIRAAQTLVPGLKQIVLVGDSFESQPFRRHYRRELQSYAEQFEVIDLAGLPIEDVKKRISALPATAAIIFSAIYATRLEFRPDPLLTIGLLSESANRPIIVDADIMIGTGSAGGIVQSTELLSRELARLTAVVLRGEPVSSLPVAMIDAVKPVFDARQLKKFNIDVSQLPLESEIRFREFSVWERYRWSIIGAFVVVLIQASAVAWLAVERIRRRKAETESQQYLLNIAQMDRTMTAGAISSSIAHELNQPFGAILSNAEAAEALLEQAPLRYDELKEILADIRRDNQRSTDIVSRLRSLLGKNEFRTSEVDLNATISTMLRIIEPEARRQGITLSDDRAPGQLLVRADAIHLQQVLLNLALNAIDAMRNNGVPRILSFRAAIDHGDRIVVSVADTGGGIPQDRLKTIFKAHYSTKPEGTGLGLFISWAIIDTYGGKLWAENRPEGGAVFKFELPSVMHSEMA
jgi:signal transduction histidine kinase